MDPVANSLIANSHADGKSQSEELPFDASFQGLSEQLARWDSLDETLQKRLWRAVVDLEVWTPASVVPSVSLEGYVRHDGKVKAIAFASKDVMRSCQYGSRVFDAKPMSLGEFCLELVSEADEGVLVAEANGELITLSPKIIENIAQHARNPIRALNEADLQIRVFSSVELELDLAIACAFNQSPKLLRAYFVATKVRHNHLPTLILVGEETPSRDEVEEFVALVRRVAGEKAPKVIVGIPAPKTIAGLLDRSATPYLSRILETKASLGL